LYEQCGRRLEEARTLLCYGELLRRDRKRSEAREILRRAAVTFDRVGATAWYERVVGELRATGETARKRVAGPPNELTPQQRQIVEGVVEGATNRAIAARLFLGPRTVDDHLRNVFVALGITSRAELTRLAGLGRRPAPALS
jgi:DNA-binding NarL/FixJ family response regulator